MFYGNGNNGGSRNDVNVNSTLTTLFSDQSSLTIGFWNDQLSLRWLNPIGQPDANGHTKYDKEHPVMTSLSFSKMVSLRTQFKEVLEEKIKNGEDPDPDGKDNVAVTFTTKSGEPGAVMIEYLTDEKGVPSTYLTHSKIVMGQAQTTRFKFNKNTICVGYDPETHTSKGEKMDEGELGLFLSVLENWILMTRMVGHGKKYSDAFARNNQSNNAGQQQYPNNNGYNAGSPQMPDMGMGNFGVFS